MEIAEQLSCSSNYKRQFELFSAAATFVLSLSPLGKAMGAKIGDLLCKFQTALALVTDVCAF